VPNITRAVKATAIDCVADSFARVFISGSNLYAKALLSTWPRPLVRVAGFVVLDN
jgi:hypothetical protein